MTLDKLSWDPILRGPVFCSPACGGRCTKRAYDAAVCDSAAMCELLGDGWKPRVWENLAWHWCVILPVGGTATVALYSHNWPNGVRYSCLIGENGSGFGGLPITKECADPKEAIRLSVAAFLKWVEPYAALTDLLPSL